MTRPVARFLSVGLFASALLFTPAALLGQTGSLALSSGSVAAGGTITLNLNWAAPAANVPAGLEWAFAYAPGNVVSINMAAGPALTAAGKTLNCNATSGTVICLASGMNANAIGSGVIATISVVVPSGIASSIPISIGNLVAALGDGTNATITGSGGIITVLQPLPAISSLLPATALAGGLSFTLTVNGAGFTPASVVNWNGVARTTTFVSATQLQVSVTALDILLAILAQVTVTNPAPGGGTSGSAAFTVSATNAVPAISSLAPASATAGAAAFTLTVNGTGFLNGSVVRWNGTSRATTFVSATQLQAAITAADIAAVGIGQVTVFNPAPGGGTSGTSAFTITATNPVPTISSLAPASATMGAAAFTLTVNGTGFLNGSVVNWNGTNRTTTFVSATQLQAAITAADIAAVGTGQVTVFNPAPGGGTSGTSAFTITATNPGPTIISLAPASATVGTAAFTLTVNGTGFLNGAVVRWNGTNRTTWFASATLLQAIITAADIATAGTGQVTVVNPAPGGTSGTSAFTITSTNPIPTISSLAPASATAGTAAFTLTVNGTGFLNGSVVNWNGTSRTTTFVSATQLQAAITSADIAAVGTGQVTVFNPAPGGTSGTSAFTITATNPIPTISSLAPASATMGAAAFTLTVNGTGFLSGSVVNWNGTSRTTTFVSATQLQAAITAADIAAVGTGQVTVFNPAPGGGTSGTSAFTITATNPVPTISLLAPASATVGAAAFTLTVNGTGFLNGSVVRWNGTNRTTTFVSATQLQAAITAADITAAGTGQVTVFNPTPGGGTSGNSAFTITTTNPVPAISSLAPASATAGTPAFALTVNGTGFLNGSVVNWNGTNRTTTFVSATQVQAAITAGDIATVGTGQVTVFNPAPGGGTSGTSAFTITTTNPMPTISSLAPASATAGAAAFTLTVNGTGFLSGSVVNWNGTSRTTTFVSATQVQAAITAADIATAGSGQVTVYNPTPGGGTSGSSAFTINSSTSTTATAAFVKTDVTTAGNWKGTYGADGYNIIGDTVSYPSYVTVTASGNYPATWASSTSATRALQKVNSTTDRIAATWYAPGAMTIDLNFKDASSHQVALYALDWDAGGARSERVDILDVNNIVLDTRSLTSFAGGVYAVWNLTGHVVIRITNTSLVNAVVAGLLFAPGPANTVPNAPATFIKTDVTTAGNWKGTYGADGYNIIGDTVSYPTYVTVTASGNYPATWASSTSDQRALQKVNSTTDRIAATWYAPGAMTIDLNFKDANSHQVALYALDWDAGGARSERVDILDVNNNVLDTRSLTSFAGGVYAVWNFTGHVVIRITNTSAVNAVVAGLLFAPGAANTGPPPPATFVKTDVTSAGSWKGTYGADGYNIIGDTVSYPSYVAVTASGNSPAMWASSTSDTRAMQKVNSTTDRIAATWYTSGAMSIDLNFKDANSHQVALYALDWDAGGARSERVDILDVNNIVLDTRTLTHFNGGAYLVWNFTGHVIMRITNTSLINAVMSGLLFGPAGAAQSPNITTASVKPGTTTFGMRKGVDGLSCSPRTVNAGGKATCELLMPASTVPQQFQLASNSAQVQLPAAVVSRSNQGRLTFQVSIDPTAKSELAVVTATLGDSQVQDKITVTSSGQPVLTAPRTRIAKLGNRLAFLVTAMDPNGMPLQLAGNGIPPGASFDPASGRFEWTPGASQEGTHRVAFVATNSALQSSDAQVMIEVDSGRPVLTSSARFACSPGSVATLTGRWLAEPGNVLSDASGSAMDLGGTKVKVNGQYVPVLFASERAVNFLCPILDPGEPVSVSVETASGVADVLATTMQEASPTILSLDGSGENQGLISFVRSTDIAMERNFRVPAHPAQPGDQILIWATGLGSEAAAGLSVKLGDVYAGVESLQALSGHAGVYAIQARIPASTAIGDSVPVELEVTGSSRLFKSNSVTLAVEAVRP